MTRGAWTLYLLRCRDGSYYAGITTDLDRRFREHAAGKGAKYTRAHPPECVLGSRSYPDRAAASHAEHEYEPGLKVEGLLAAADAASAG